MKIAFIIPKLANQGPILVVKDLIDQIKDKVDLIDVYYFDNVNEIEFGCDCYKISFLKRMNFDKYDIVHSHMLRPDLYIWLNRNCIKRAKCISTLHQDIYQNLKSSYNLFAAFIFEKLWLRALRSQNVVITLTNIMQQQYQQRLKNVTVITIYNGRSLSIVDNFDNDEKLMDELISIKLKYKAIGVSALLTKRKGVDQIIKALPLLSDYALIIVGDGKEKQNLIKLAQELNVYDRCFFLGYKINGQRFLKFFDIYAMSSYSEGFPLALLEAGQYKIPIICSNISIFRELFAASEVAYFELNNSDSFKNAILNIEKNYAFYSENISKKISKSYSVQKMGEKYLRLYNGIL